MMCYRFLTSLSIFYLKKLSTEAAVSGPIISPTSGSVEIILTDYSPFNSIYSTNYGEHNYTKNSDVTYNVKVALQNEVEQRGASIRVTLSYFAIEQSQLCSKDRLEIQDPADEVHVCCGILSGKFFLMRGRFISIRFKSDSEIEDRGYVIHLNIEKSPCTETFLFTSPSYAFTSPNFPRKYGSNSLCVWKIIAPLGYQVELTFHEKLDIQDVTKGCLNAALIVNVNGSFDQNSQRYCGNSLPKPILSQNTTLLVMFTSDCCQHGAGFNASFAFVEEKVKHADLEDAPHDCRCGLENIVHKRSANSKEVTPQHKYPWVVALVHFYVQPTKVICGGTLISSRYVVTAAHCVYSHETISTLGVVLGAHYQHLMSTETISRLEHIFIHKEYNHETWLNNIALLKLMDTAIYSHAVRPACIPVSKNLDIDDRVGVISGWGASLLNGETSNALQSVELLTLPLAKCHQIYSSKIFNSTLCATGNSSGGCNNDWGGPFTTRLGGRHVLVGIYSWNKLCGDQRFPSVFTRITSHIRWMKSYMPNSPACEARIPRETGVFGDSALQPNVQDCGVPNRDTIVGGSIDLPMFKHEYPWICTIRYNQEFKAAGTLISTRFVLTTRSWMPINYRGSPELLTVTLGCYNLSKNYEKDSKSYKVAIVMEHRKFGKGIEFNNDLVILQLEENVKSAFRPICFLRPNDYIPEAKSLFSAGWGRALKENRRNNHILEEILLKKMNDRSCYNAYSTMTSTMVCVQAEGKGLCTGDAGAPLMYEYKGRIYLVGAMSFGPAQKCTAPGKPDVFTSVFSRRIIKWIKNVTHLNLEAEGGDSPNILD